MKKGLVFLSIFLSTTVANAQLWLIAANSLEVCALFQGVQAETKISSMGQQQLVSFGAKGLMVLADNFTLGFGYHAGYSTSDNIKVENPYYTVMETISVTGEYHSRAEEKMHLSFPVGLGFGQAYNQASTYLANFGYAEPGINLVYRPFDCAFTVGGGVGYRQTIGADSGWFNDANLSAPSVQLFVAYGL